jgi:preprotein translocase subunit SecA
VSRRRAIRDLAPLLRAAAPARLVPPPRIAPPTARLHRPYIQRRVPPMNWTDRSAKALAGFVATLGPRRLRDRRRIARVLAALDALAGADAAALRREVAALRQRVRTDGLRPDLLERAVALVAASARDVTGMRPRPVQVSGALLLLDGAMLEMATGEGKTFTAALAAGAAAIAGMRPHVITVNDYLAARDCEGAAAIFAPLGLSTGLVVSDTEPGRRPGAYACDVVFVTNTQVAFDYLKDIVALGPARSPARRLLRAGIGTPDSVPVPRTILSGLHFAIVDAADGVLADEASTPLIISASQETPPDAAPYIAALRLARGLRRETDWFIEADERRIRLTPAGRAALARRAPALGGAWRVAAAREDRVRQALQALHLYERDRHYILGPDPETGETAVIIVDESTGRPMPDRSWEGGLHQCIEVKEGLAPTALRQTIARVTYQRFFRQYLRMSGMTGTGMEIAGEMRSFFDLTTYTVPPHRPLRRRFLGVRMLPDAPAKIAAVVARTQEMVARGRPVLVGTRTVAASEAVSAALHAAGVAHVVLNARQDADEAELVAAAGAAGAVTVATNMAGRGTDIALSEAAREAGGLHVILTEHHESRRVDRQLHGRAGRQGDPGSCEDIVARDDALYARFVPGLARLCRPLPAALAAPLLRRAMQRRAEALGAQHRRQQFSSERDVARLSAIAGAEHG